MPALFNLPDNYEVLEELGKGAFGVVHRAIMTVSGEAGEPPEEVEVAIKKVVGLDHSPVRARYVARELAALIRFRFVPYVVRLHEIVGDPTSPGDVYIVMDYYKGNLRDTNLSKTTEMTEGHVRYIMSQILLGLRALKMGSCIHRDLSPVNVLIDDECNVVIADFGLSRAHLDDSDMSEGVVTLWYRAPEILLEWRRYSYPVDAWSAGCILAELLLRRAFLTGKDNLSQLHHILLFTGTPDLSELAEVGSERGRTYMGKLRKVDPADLVEMFPQASTEALDVLKALLVFNPHKRSDIESVLQMEWFANADEATKALVDDGLSMSHADFHLPSSPRATHSPRSIPIGESLPQDTPSKLVSEDADPTQLSFGSDGDSMGIQLLDTCFESMSHEGVLDWITTKFGRYI